jgi:hypothetical protein
MRTRLLVSVFLFCVMGGPAAPARAAGVVTICDEPHLLAALAGGGTVTFACDGVIPLSAGLTIIHDTVLDAAGHAVTLSGGGTTALSLVPSGKRLELRDLALVDGNAGSASGGAVSNSGMLVARRVRFADNDAALGGAIYNDDSGVVTLEECTLSGNAASTYGGGAIFNTGVLTVRGSTFSRNTAPGNGGAIVNWQAGLATISDSEFTGNSGGQGGAIDTSNDLLVSRSVFSQNVASRVENDILAPGGAIYIGDGPIHVTGCTFTGNRSGGVLGRGGGIYISDGSLQIRESWFSGNTAVGGDGGALYLNSKGVATVSRSAFSGNAAPGSAGGALRSSGDLTAANITVWGNSAASGAALLNRGAATLANATIAGNRSDAASAGIANLGTGTLTLSNTIAASPAAGRNCSGAIADSGGNVSWGDTTCPGLKADPLLGAFQNNGGSTPTMALGTGSPARDAGLDGVCSRLPVGGLDQRGYPRPFGPQCDAGAYEAQPGQMGRNKYLPGLEWQ